MNRALHEFTRNQYIFDTKIIKTNLITKNLIYFYKYYNFLKKYFLQFINSN